MSADLSNLHTAPTPNNGFLTDDGLDGTGGFFAFGVDGMFRGAAIILFAFIAFDTTIMSQPIQIFPNSNRLATNQRSKVDKIENFIRTITNAILSINAGLFLCMLGMALALATIQPYYRLVSVNRALFVSIHSTRFEFLNSFE